LVFEIKKIIFSFLLTKPIVACFLDVLNEPSEYPTFIKSFLKSSNVVIEIAPPDELPNREELFPLKTSTFSIISKLILSV